MDEITGTTLYANRLLKVSKQQSEPTEDITRTRNSEDEEAETLGLLISLPDVGSPDSRESKDKESIKPLPLLSIEKTYGISHFSRSWREEEIVTQCVTTKWSSHRYPDDETEISRKKDRGKASVLTSSSALAETSSRRAGESETNATMHSFQNSPEAPSPTVELNTLRSERFSAPDFDTSSLDTPASSSQAGTDTNILTVAFTGSCSSGSRSKETTKHSSSKNSVSRQSSSKHSSARDAKSKNLNSKQANSKDFYFNSKKSSKRSTSIHPTSKHSRTENSPSKHSCSKKSFSKDSYSREPFSKQPSSHSYSNNRLKTLIGASSTQKDSSFKYSSDVGKSSVDRSNCVIAENVNLEAPNSTYIVTKSSKPCPLSKKGFLRVVLTKLIVPNESTSRPRESALKEPVLRTVNPENMLETPAPKNYNPIAPDAPKQSLRSTPEPKVNPPSMPKQKEGPSSAHEPISSPSSAPEPNVRPSCAPIEDTQPDFIAINRLPRIPHLKVSAQKDPIPSEPIPMNVSTPLLPGAPVWKETVAVSPIPRKLIDIVSGSTTKLVSPQASAKAVAEALILDQPRVLTNLEVPILKETNPFSSSPMQGNSEAQLSRTLAVSVETRKIPVKLNTQVEQKASETVRTKRRQRRSRPFLTWYQRRARDIIRRDARPECPNYPNSFFHDHFLPTRAGNRNELSQCFERSRAPAIRSPNHSSLKFQESIFPMIKNESHPYNTYSDDPLNRVGNASRDWERPRSTLFDGFPRRDIAAGRIGQSWFFETSREVPHEQIDIHNRPSDRSKVQKCKLCSTWKIEVALFPCAHAALCLMCSRGLVICPFCERPVIEARRILLPTH